MPALNKLLYSAIAELAPVANAVKIEIAASLRRDSGFLSHLPVNGGARGHLKSYLLFDSLRRVKYDHEIDEFVDYYNKASCATTAIFEYVAHLPYNSFRNMGVIAETGGSPAFWLDLRLHDGLNTFYPTYFLIDEVRSISLAQVADPEFSLHIKEPGQMLSPSHSSLYHYLLFRDFSCEGVVPQAAKGTTIPSLYLPSFNLFSPGSCIGKCHNVNGFAALFYAPDMITLYEFDNAPVQSENPHRSALAAKVIPPLIFGGLPSEELQKQMHMRVYTDNAAITRLHEVKDINTTPPS
jgi:hypothetical protein